LPLNKGGKDMKRVLVIILAVGLAGVLIWEGVNQHRIMEDISSIKRDIRSISWDISSLDGDIGSVEEDVSSIKKDISSIESDINSIQWDIWRLTLR